MTSEDDLLDALQGTTHFICPNGHVVRVDSDSHGGWWRHRHSETECAGFDIYLSMEDTMYLLPLAVEVYDDDA